MIPKELFRRSTPEELTAKVNDSFLREEQPLVAQQEKLNDCLFLIYTCLDSLRVEGGWTNLEVGVPAGILSKAGFVSTKQKDHLTLADKVSLKASFEPNGALTLEEKYFRTDPAVQGDLQLNLHRDMYKIFIIKKSKRGFKISPVSVSSAQIRLEVSPRNPRGKVLPQAYREISGTQFSTAETKIYSKVKITPKDINRLLFTLFSGLFYGPLHPPSSPVRNGN